MGVWYSYYMTYSFINIYIYIWILFEIIAIDNNINSRRKTQGVVEKFTAKRPNSNHTTMAAVKNKANRVLVGSQGDALTAGHFGWQGLRAFGATSAAVPAGDLSADGWRSPPQQWTATTPVGPLQHPAAAVVVPAIETIRFISTRALSRSSAWHA